MAHAGEEGPPEHVGEALDLLGVGRIDHGVWSVEDSTRVGRLAREGVPLTIYPLSNVGLDVADSLVHHHLKRLLDAGVRVTINSDDPAYFGGYVTDNYVAAQRALGLNRAEVYRIASNKSRPRRSPLRSSPERRRRDCSASSMPTLRRGDSRGVQSLERSAGGFASPAHPQIPVETVRLEELGRSDDSERFAS